MKFGHARFQRRKYSLKGRRSRLLMLDGEITAFFK